MYLGKAYLRIIAALLLLLTQNMVEIGEKKLTKEI